MDKAVKVETSRRNVLAYLGLMTFSLAAVPTVLASDAQAQTAGMERREERREGRETRRENRRSGRQGRRNKRRGATPAPATTPPPAATGAAPKY